MSPPESKNYIPIYGNYSAKAEVFLVHRLLCVTAHPDDEAGAFGGSLLLYAQRGVETNLICLTPGQAATHRGGASSEDELSAMRRKELADSARLLKLTHFDVLDYPDGRLDRLNFHAVVADLTERIRRIRPHVVLTIGPEGAITAHPDHSMVSLFTTLAYHWAGRTNRFPEQFDKGLQPHRAQKLYYGTATFTLADRQPVSLPPVTATIDIGELLETKVRAFRMHTSQSPLFDMAEAAMRQRGAIETFHLAATITPREIPIETDLFEGVVDE
jgi:LmbE family N-acetylglucosaminyl deacetylase